jgi:hypothetical protein
MQMKAVITMRYKIACNVMDRNTNAEKQSTIATK